MTQSIPVLTTTVRATGAIARGRGVTFAGAQVAAAGAKPQGIAVVAAVAGQDVSLVSLGSAACEAGAAVAIGAAVAFDSVGRVVTAAALAIAAGGTTVTSTAANGAAIITGGDVAQWVVGDAMQAAGAAGDFIEILLRR